MCGSNVHNTKNTCMSQRSYACMPISYTIDEYTWSIFIGERSWVCARDGFPVFDCESYSL